MAGSQRGLEGGHEIVVRSRHVTVVHLAGVVLAIVALWLGGFDNPSVGFPIAISVLISLDVPPSPVVADRRRIEDTHGSVLEGGIRRANFVKGMFAVALLYAGLMQFLAVLTLESSFRILLGTALALSAGAGELEARALRNLHSSLDG
jgi:hypothetical protein